MGLVGPEWVQSVRLRATWRDAKPRKASWRDDAGFLRHARLVWGKREAASIVRQEAARLLFDLASTAPIAANRTRSVLLKMYGWAVDSGLLDINPLHGVRKPGRENSKTRTLSDAEIRLIWRVLDTTTKAEPGTVAALKTLLLLGQRPAKSVAWRSANCITSMMHDRPIGNCRQSA